MAGHPTDVIFLTCDAFAVLPPVTKLTPAQAMYHFISGYTAKVAGTEMGISEPEATFSACFGGPFLVWHPTKYAELLAAKMQRHRTHAWLVNTGWTGGPYGVGSRISIAHTRALLRAALSGALDEAAFRIEPYFSLRVPLHVPGVPDDLLDPSRTWPSPEAYAAQARHLVRLFEENFAKFAGTVAAEFGAQGSAVHA